MDLPSVKYVLITLSDVVPEISWRYYTYLLCIYVSICRVGAGRAAVLAYRNV